MDQNPRPNHHYQFQEISPVPHPLQSDGYHHPQRVIMDGSMLAQTWNPHPQHFQLYPGNNQLSPFQSPHPELLPWDPLSHPLAPKPIHSPPSSLAPSSMSESPSPFPESSSFVHHLHALRRQNHHRHHPHLQHPQLHHPQHQLHQQQQQQELQYSLQEPPEHGEYLPDPFTPGPIAPNPLPLPCHQSLLGAEVLVGEKFVTKQTMEGTLVASSSNIQKFLGFESRLLQDTQFYSLIHKDDLLSVLEAHSKLLYLNSTPVAARYRLQRKDGQYAEVDSIFLLEVSDHLSWMPSNMLILGLSVDISPERYLNPTPPLPEDSNSPKVQASAEELRKEIEGLKASLGEVVVQIDNTRQELQSMKRGRGSEEPEGSSQAKPKRERKSRKPMFGDRCGECGVKESSEWRKGPDPALLLCNACGLRYHRKIKKDEHRIGENPELS